VPDANTQTLERTEPVWRPQLRLPPSGDVGSVIMTGLADIVTTDYLLHRLDEGGEIQCSEVIHADTIAEALQQVVDRVNRAERAEYQLWLGGSKLATIESNPRPPLLPKPRTSWLGRLFRR
jgi:hypothetical protein